MNGSFSKMLWSEIPNKLSILRVDEDVWSRLTDVLDDAPTEGQRIGLKGIVANTNRRGDVVEISETIWTVPWQTTARFGNCWVLPGEEESGIMAITAMVVTTMIRQMEDGWLNVPMRWYCVEVCQRPVAMVKITRIPRIQVVNKTYSRFCNGDRAMPNMKFREQGPIFQAHIRRWNID